MVNGPKYVRIEGIDNMNRAMKNLTPSTRRAVKEQFAWEQDIMFSLSQVYTPKDTRALAQSGEKIGPNDIPTGIEAGISYGGMNLNPKTGETTNSYVVNVHEDLDMRHLHPTRAKFAETAVLERMPALENRIARFVGPQVEAELMVQQLTNAAVRRGVR